MKTEFIWLDLPSELHFGTSFQISQLYINEWLIMFCFLLNPSHHVTVISAIACTMSSSEEVKENFYEDLELTPPNDKPLLLGDYNARVGNDFKNWKGVLGHHGFAK